MKHIKKIVSVVLILMTVFALAVPASAATTTKYVKVSQGPGHTVNLRKEPNTNSQILDKPTYGSAIYVNSTSNGWCSVTYYNPVTKTEHNGYIASEYLVSSIPSDTYWIVRYGTLDHKLTNSYNEGCVALQESLNDALDENLDTDGICGSKTVAAIKEFQRANNLTADGIAGNRTKEYLFKLGY